MVLGTMPDASSEARNASNALGRSSLLTNQGTVGSSVPAVAVIWVNRWWW